MSVEITHGCDDCPYRIEEYNNGRLERYILLDTDELKQLSKLLKKAGF